MIDRNQFYCRLAGGATGLMLAASNLWAPLAPIQAVALIPILFVDARGKVKKDTILAAGMYMGLAYTLPQIVYLRLPIIITVILLLHLTVLMMLLNFGWHMLLGKRVIAASFAAGAFLVVIDWLNFTVLPMWGTSQSLARSWSAWPALIQFVSLTGITGIVFALGTLEAITVYAILRPKTRRLLAAVAAVIILAITGVNIALQRNNTKHSIKVAAIGWLLQDDGNSIDPHSAEGFDELFAQPVGRAAAEGAKLVVTGEMAFHLDKHTRVEWMERFGDICKRHDIYLAVGCYDKSDEENRVLFIAPNGEIMAQYTKTHLTPFEHSNRGDGQLTIVDIDGVRTGALICQDDNFTSLTRDYGRKRVPLMAVPTLDWSTVKDVHLQTTIHRAIESRQAIVRAAINGTSAIISPTGKVLAKSDHFKDGPSMIIAQVPIHSKRTLFARWGHWPVILSSIYLAWYIGSTRRNVRRPRSRVAGTGAGSGSPTPFFNRQKPFSPFFHYASSFGLNPEKPVFFCNIFHIFESVVMVE